MLVTYLRSSTVSAFQWCQHKQYLVYGLGLEDISGRAAEKGTATHKALELLARKKLALQRGAATVLDEELKVELALDELTTDRAFDLAYEHHAQPSWTEGDRRDCRKWMETVLTFQGGLFNPLSLEIVAPEQYFDLTIDRPWAHYSYVLPDGRTLEGQLAVRGTMDLITRMTPRRLHYLDYKTGQRKDWQSGQEKTYEDMHDDFQFLLYYYALCNLYPQDEIYVTVFYIRDGGPFTLCLDRAKDLHRAEAAIRKWFETIRDTTRPTLTYDDPRHRWKCLRLCTFFANQWQDTGKSVCQHFRDEIVQLGMEKVTAKYANIEKVLNYGQGGGQSKRE